MINNKKPYICKAFYYSQADLTVLNNIILTITNKKDI